MIKNKKYNDQAHAMIVQNHQIEKSQTHLSQIDDVLSLVRIEQEGNQKTIDQLLSQAESFIDDGSVVFDMLDDDNLLIAKNLFLNQDDVVDIHQEFQLLDSVGAPESKDWNQYLLQIESYAARNDIVLKGDPFKGLMSVSQQITLEKRIKEEFSLKAANCDKFDYMIAGTCGLIGGLVDILYVGVPGESSLGNFAHDYTEKATEKFASLLGFSKEKIEEKYNLYVQEKLKNGGLPLALDKYIAQRRIQFLEGRFKINYDQSTTNGKNGTGGKVDNLTPSNHHMKSLGHSPDIVGLFFSIVNQFTSTSSFVSGGRLITIDTENFELEGGNFIAKIFCGFVNWFGHIMSDFAGSNSSIAKGNSGMGVPIPFYSLLQFLDFGEFGQHRQSFATTAVKVFEQGYDFRHGLAMAVPVLITELLTRITWVIKQRFYHDKPWVECIPSANNPELRRMLLIAHGSLCLVDTADAALRSGGDMISFMLRSNLIAWARFGTLALTELAVWYRAGGLDVASVDLYLDAEYKRLLST